MKLIINIIAAVMLLCACCKVKGSIKVMPDDPPVIQISSDDFTDSSSKRSLNDSACCESGNFTTHSLADILNNISATVNITNDIVLSSNVTLEGLENITIIGHRNPVVHCNDAGALRFISCKNVTIEGIQWEGCGSKDYPSIEFYNSSNVSFERCSFHNSKGRSVFLSKVSGNVYINNCNFTHNIVYSGHGAAIHYLPNTSSSQQPNLVIQHSKFIFNKASQSTVYIDSSVSRIPGNVHLIDSVFINNTGVPVYISHTNLHIRGSVLFNGNSAMSGGGIYSRNSIIMVNDNSKVKFISNSVTTDGGAIYQTYSNIIFGANSIVTFEGNTAHIGGAVHSVSANITFDGSSIAIFSNNTANTHGGAIYFTDRSKIIFDGNSCTTFNNNSANVDGGAVYSFLLSHIGINGNSKVTFNHNEAKQDGGAVHCYIASNITFDNNSSVRFINNRAGHDGGAVYCYRGFRILFLESTFVSFVSNMASNDGGAIYSNLLPQIIFENNSTVILNNNTAGQDGGVIVSSSVTFKGSSNVMFYNNLARRDGAAIHYIGDSKILFGGNSSVMFYNNAAVEQGGAIYLIDNAKITFQQGCNVTFLNNTARKSGGAVYIESSSNFLLGGNSVVTFEKNKARQSGGALFITDLSTAIFTGHSQVTYYNNEVTQYGGAIYCDGDSNVLVGGNTTVQFTNNTSDYYGGSLSLLKSFIIVGGDSLVSFIGNKADSGAAISTVTSSVTFANNSQTQFLNNSAGGSGGAIHLSENFIVNFLSDCHITFYSNTADRHGGAMYCDLTKSTDSKITLNTSDIAFGYNADFVGSDIYMDITRSCDKTCLDNYIMNKGHSQFNGTIKASPRQLKFNDSAVLCVDNDNDTNCQKYLTTNIMLGQKITFNACATDYYNQPAGSMQFVLNSQDQNFRIIGSESVLISCALSEDISIKGKRVLEAFNFTLTFTLYDGSNSDLKKFSIELIIELSPCHPGFHYNNNTQTCVCYSDRDIVSCSGSTSSIKRGYWSGEINDKATVTVCPNSYCNFSCCETFNGFVELSPFRVNQCNSHRSGPACGSCKKGYTLSFDSIECVSADKCTAGQTVLVVTLSILYWVVIVILVFIVTYYHIGIGYLYAITYYYSMVDILLGEHLYLSQGLFNLIITLSSIAKVTPQFLGQLCLVTNMSGIDQQFIHYVHPLAVAVIVTLICVAARISYRLSSLVSRGIIHVICFLLLLSYTSVATTSLLLLRSLTFDNVDKTYTYLSPDIMYLHGRHLPYFITAILCTIVIVISLPCLLLFEPYLNHKINFTRIKPLLDQFQGCYKDKYRSFAAYYMTCRLVIILIIISNPSNHDNSQYLLIILNSLLAFIHVTLRPYKSNILNVFDSFVLQLMIVISMVPLIDNYDHHLLIMFMFLLVILPLIPFVGMEILLYKKMIKKIMRYCVPPKPGCHNEVAMTDIANSVADVTRRVKVNEKESDCHYRESFMEVMDEIED